MINSKMTPVEVLIIQEPESNIKHAVKFGPIQNMIELI
jgi:hypothetical protein